MIIGIVGYAGDGKTLLSVIYTTHLIYGNPVNKNGKIVSKYQLITNIRSLKIPHIDFEQNFLKIIKDIDSKPYEVNVQPRLLVIDEIQNYLDSRRSMRNFNIEFSQEFFQIRKKGFDCIYTLQDYMSLDARIRRITQFLLLPTYDKYKKEFFITITDNRLNNLGYKQFKISDMWYQMYNTYEKITGNVVNPKDSMTKIKGTDYYISANTD